MKTCSCRQAVPLLVLTLTAFARSAAGWTIEVHEEMTRRACELESAEFPILVLHADRLRAGAAGEDRNLVVKWSRYNHFYKPTEPVRTLYRETSDVRVRMLWAEVETLAQEGKLSQAFDRAGRLLHHIQDMACPAHVVPVNHGPLDRFERYANISDLIAAAVGDGVGEDLSGPEAHHRLARDTFDAVKNGTLQAGGRTIPWAAFWREKAGRFGEYGPAGNRFGRSRIPWEGATLEVAPAEYVAFMRRRVEATVGYSRSFLRWAAGEIERISGRRPM